ncbi:MAG: ABC transporter permease [Bacteroidia bacterium]|nr:ABC transporter permease [Bacteroidia bacterium]
MVKYFFRKLIYGILILWGVVTVIFLLFNVLPGDPARMMLGQRADISSVETIKKDLGLDRPLWMQYIKYLNDLSPLSVHNAKNENSFYYLDTNRYASFVRMVSFSDKVIVLKAPYLRRSYQSKRNVSNIIAETLPNTFILALTSIIFASVIGIAIGIFAAVKKDTLFDKAMLFFSSFGMSLPSFFAAILVGWLFAFVLGKYTGLNLTGNLFTIDDFGEGRYLELKNLILPTLTLGIRPLSIVMQLSRSSILDVLSQDYIRTAKAKGLSYKAVILKHALKNSLNPVVTAISGWFASLMAGVVFIEFIFGWKGMGFVIVDSLNKYDLPLVLGCVLTISAMFVIINFFVDLIYGVLDPRVRIT